MNHLKKHIVIAVLAGIFGLVFGAFVSVMAVGSSVEETLEALNLEGDPDDGALIYEESCQSCHLPAANGDPAGAFPQLASQHSTVIIKQITDIRAGNRDNPTMLPFADIEALKATIEDVFDTPKDGAQALADVASYIQTIEPTNKIVGEGKDLVYGEEIYREKCGSCHLDHGQGSWSQHYPVIAGQNYKYLIRQFEWIKIGKRRNANSKTVELMQDFDDRQMKSTMDWVSRQKFLPGDRGSN